VWGPNSERQTQEFVSELIDTWDVPDERRVRWAWVADEPNRGVIGAGELHIRSRVHRQGEITYARDDL
jgi:[ribosomal protein S5]-alanine N-acetyltransferase